MKKPALIFLLLFLASFGFGQAAGDTVNIEQPEQTIVTDPEFPHYPGGLSEMLKFIDDNFHHPDSVKLTKAEDRIILKISVDTTGAFSELLVLKGIDPAYDNELLRVFSIMPRWVPAVVNGKKVARTFVLPVKFKQNEGKHGIED